MEILSLPGRFWRWRMDGAAPALARRFPELGEVDLLVATDMLDLSVFLGLTREATGRLPVLLYMHENQLTYPLSEDDESDGQGRAYGMCNVNSMLAADRIAFNSEFHRRELLEALPDFLGRAPDHRLLARLDEIRERSLLLPVGLETSDIETPTGRAGSGPPLLLWNQRWEYDKDPAALMRALCALADDGATFEVALCGESAGRVPEELEAGIEALGDRVVQAGWLPRDRYVELLGRSTIVLSTARHEFFGVAVMEAVAAGALPLLPRRLSYPELLPEEAHDACLYDDEAALLEMLCEAVRDGEGSARIGADLAASVRRRFDWSEVAPRYDERVDDLVAANASGDRS